jgi:peptidoglycan/xylan/chitin deacetylase (PgdA/CDA1 family)
LTKENEQGESRRFSPAEETGVAAFGLSLVLAFFHIEWVIVPLSIFIFICLAAPFFPSLGFFLPVISRGHTGKSVVSLTFDDGPDPLTTRPLLHLLRLHAVKATFFVTGEKAEEYADLIEEILVDGHDIGNHSYRHDPLLMLRSYQTLCREIDATQAVLNRFGILPVAFRPPAGITSPKLGPVLHKRKLYCVTYTCRALDAGNKHIRGMSSKILKKVKPDDIILLHDTHPKDKGSEEAWLKEIDSMLSGLKNKELRIITLAELIGKPVMVKNMK